MALINMPADVAVVQRLLDAGTVVVMRNLHRNGQLEGLFNACCAHMTTGQTYSNGKIAILNPHPKLQREDFSLWL